MGGDKNTGGGEHDKRGGADGGGGGRKEKGNVIATPVWQFRCLENWVRTVLIRTLADPAASAPSEAAFYDQSGDRRPSSRVLQLFCGEGSVDIGKFHRAGVSHYLGIDPFATHCDAARAAWISRGCPYRADFNPRDVASDPEPRVPWSVSALDDPAEDAQPRDAAFCFSSHGLNRFGATRDSLRLALRHVSRRLREGGYFAGTVLDASEIWRQAQGERAGRPGANHYDPARPSRKKRRRKHGKDRGAGGSRSRKGPGPSLSASDNSESSPLSSSQSSSSSSSRGLARGNSATTRTISGPLHHVAVIDDSGVAPMTASTSSSAPGHRGSGHPAGDFDVRFEPFGTLAAVSLRGLKTETVPLIHLGALVEIARLEGLRCTCLDPLPEFFEARKGVSWDSLRRSGLLDQGSGAPARIAQAQMDVAALYAVFVFVKEA